jgi:hypothetical protein
MIAVKWMIMSDSADGKGPLISAEELARLMSEDLSLVPRTPEVEAFMVNLLRKRWPNGNRKYRMTKIKRMPEMVEKAGLKLDDPYVPDPKEEEEERVFQLDKELGFIPPEMTKEDWNDLDYW